MPAKRPLAVSTHTNIGDEERVTTTKKRIVEDKENRTRPAGKSVVKERKTSSSLTAMYGDEIEQNDEFDDLVPKKQQRKPSKPRAKPAEEPKKTKHREPTPELTEESSIDSIQEFEADTSITSIDESFIQQSAPKQKPRPRSSSAQPKPKVKSTPQTNGVKGRKPKLAVVPETQIEVSIVEEEEDEVEEVAPRRRQGSVLPASMTGKAYERPSNRDPVKELQTRGERNFAAYKERAEIRFKAADDHIADLQAQLANQKDTVKPSQIKELESKVKSLQAELQKAIAALEKETSQNTILTARLKATAQTSASQLREELHSDLTGLIFRNVERNQGNTVFDCLQIGKNGTLHYKLAMEDKDANDPHGQIVYTPLLDAQRDEKILNVLPDYLTDEIMFAREQASMFYWRLNQYLQKKVE